MPKKSSKEEFIARAKKIHNDRYDYSKVVYVGTHIKIIIICPIHGEFEQRPSAHLQGCGCCKCGFINMASFNRLTLEEFIKRSIIVHGYKYDYSQSVYIKANKKIKIICPVHGSFYQVAIDHIGGHGCSKCGSISTGNLIKSNIKEFIEKAKEVHGDKYDYSEVVYVNSYDKVIITCKEHGDFNQSPNNHLGGAGCPICKGIACSKLLLSNKEEFINKARLIHGNKYDYRKVVYINSWTKVVIICPIHGEFEQKPLSHLNRHCCIKCGIDNNIIKRSSTTEEFITKARLIHGDKYDYNKVGYKNNKSRIIIICPIHGEFEQAANAHLSNQGCPLCKSSKGELAIKAILDKHNIQHVQEYRLPEVVNRLLYDFYLPDYKLLIEFHGRQHYEYIPFFHRNGKDDLLKQKNRDDLVRHNARYFKYRYIEFNYKQLKHMTKEEFENLFLRKINTFITHVADIAKR